MLRIALAGLHLLALAIGLAAVLSRGSFLKDRATPSTIRRALRADVEWGIAAGLWVATGLWRWFAGTEKDTGYYIHNHVFLTKMALFVLIFGLEIWPMLTLIRWRTAIAKGAAPESVANPVTAQRIATISYTQGVLVVIMVFLAVMMARGLGSR